MKIARILDDILWYGMWLALAATVTDAFVAPQYFMLFMLASILVAVVGQWYRARLARAIEHQPPSS